MLYAISGLVVELQGASDDLKSSMAKYTLPLPQERERICDLGIVIQRSAAIPMPEERIYQENGFWRMVHTSKGETIYRVLPEFPEIVSARIDFKENKATISLFVPDGAEFPVDFREQLCTGLAFSQLVLSHQRMVLHSSCIAKNGKAVLFSAPSGTGKSTHTGLWKQYYPETIFVNDDTPVLRLDEAGKVFACGSPWSGKTRLNENVTLPLAAIVFLERGETNTITPLAPSEALGRLLGECRKLPFYESIAQAADLCGSVLERVPMYRLTCDISRQAVEVVRKELKL